MEEGVDFIFYASPKEIIIGESTKAVGVSMIKTVLGAKDESGRQRMEEVNASDFQVKADIVIMALGFNPSIPAFFAENGIETNEWGGVIVDDNHQTSTSGIYAGGDCYRGADLVVTAAFDGREAARSIIKSLG